MKRKFIFLLTAVLCNAFFISCESDNSVTCPEDYTGALDTTEEKLVGEWVLTAMTADTEIDLTDDSEENPSEDLFAQYGDCQKDASYTFSTNRDYTYDQSQNAADCDNKVVLGGTWKLSGDLLSLTGSCNVQNIPLNFKDDDSAYTFTDTFNIVDVNGQTTQAKVTFTYTAQ